MLAFTVFTAVTHFVQILVILGLFVALFFAIPYELERGSAEGFSRTGSRHFAIVFDRTA